MSRNRIACPHCRSPLVKAQTTTAGGLRIVPEKGVIASDTQEPGTVAVRCSVCVRWFPIPEARIVIYRDAETESQVVGRSDKMSA